MVGTNDIDTVSAKLDGAVTTTDPFVTDDSEKLTFLGNDCEHPYLPEKSLSWWASKSGWAKAGIVIACVLIFCCCGVVVCAPPTL